MVARVTDIVIPRGTSLSVAEMVIEVSGSIIYFFEDVVL